MGSGILMLLKLIFKDMLQKRNLTKWVQNMILESVNVQDYQMEFLAQLDIVFHQF